ncbi:hypothetical protein NFI96_032666, partial [Prochilodus magdalenae]
TSGQVTVTQTPTEITVSPGDSVYINCKTSTENLHSYNMLCMSIPIRYLELQTGPGPPDRSSFSGSGYKTDFTLTISNVQPEDAGDYYCKSQHGTSGSVFPQ